MKDEKAPFAPSACSPRTRVAAKRRPVVEQAHVRRAKATLAELEAAHDKLTKLKWIFVWEQDDFIWKHLAKAARGLVKLIEAKRREESRAADGAGSADRGLPVERTSRAQ